MNIRETDEALRQKAVRLKLTYMRDNMPELMRAATESKMTPREVLEYVLGKEVDRRDANRVKLAMMAAHFPRACTLESFDYAAQPAVDPGTIRELAKMEWGSRRRERFVFGTARRGENTSGDRARPRSSEKGVFGFIPLSQRACKSA